MPETAAAVDNFDYVVAEPEHVDALSELFALFFKESQYSAIGVELDFERGKRWVARAIDIHSPQHILAFDKETGTLAGALGYVIDWTASIKPFAYLDKIYVRPEWRGHGIASTLVMLATDLAKSDGCVAFRAGISGGIGDGRKPFLRHGFIEVPGSVLLAKRL